MGRYTKIGWCDHTFNPWWGCTKISPGCKFCYADGVARRWGHKVWGPGVDRKLMSADHWRTPMRWNRNALRDRVRRRVFCGSMMDIGEKNPALDPQRIKLAGLIRATPFLDWLCLTKRPAELQRIMEGWDWPDRAWFGISAENQCTLDARWTEASSARSPIIFISAEPLLGAIDLPVGFLERGARSWLILGGESGKGARICHLPHLRRAMAQCKEAGVPVFVKQLGARASDPENGLAGAALEVDPDVAELISHRLRSSKGENPKEWPRLYRVQQFPKVAA